MDIASVRFDSSFRPVPLETHVIGYPKSEKTNGFIFEKTLNKNLAQVKRTINIQRFGINI